MNRLLVILISVVVLLSLAGCTDTEKEQRARIYADSVSMAALRTALTNCQQDRSNELDQKNAIQTSLDSALYQLEVQKKELAAKNRIVKQQKAAAATYVHTVDSVMQQVNTSTQQLQGQLQDVKTLRESDAIEMTNLRNQLTLCNDILTAARPWRDYYREDADRGFFNRLFGAGKPKKPATLDPW